MGVPGNHTPNHAANDAASRASKLAPERVAQSELFAVDAYLTKFEATVVAVDEETGGVALDRTAFYPVGGGQPWDLGTLRSHEQGWEVTSVRRESGMVWHTIAAGRPGDSGADAATTGGVPAVGTSVYGRLTGSVVTI